MRISLKSVLLLTALVAVIVAWMRVTADTAAVERVLMRNANKGQTELTVDEAEAPSSTLVIDATGAVTHARLSGPNGFAEIDSRLKASSQIRSISLNSSRSVEMFADREFPNLTWLSINDGFDIDFNQFSFGWLKRRTKLEGLNIFAYATDPRPALATFPDMQPLMVVLRTSEARVCEEFPEIASVSKLVVGLPDGANAEAFLEIAGNRMPACEIEIENHR